MTLHFLAREKGDQTGRISGFWAVVCFGQFIENYRSSLNVLATFFHGKRILGFWAVVCFGQFIENYRSSLNVLATFVHGKKKCINLDKNELGHILGDFLTSSSGHPAREQCLLRFQPVFSSAVTIFVGLKSRVARWHILKSKTPIWVIL
jgi:hypothetical protein